VILKNQAAIEKFLDVNQEHPEMTKFFMPTGTELRSDLYLGDTYKDFKFKTRVIACVYNKGDYDEELEEIKLVARRSAANLNVRIATITDPKLIKVLKKETSWFGDASLNTVILKRYDGKIFNLDML
jgi:hypothetical protein